MATYLSSRTALEEFEEQIAGYIGTRSAVVFSSGRAAIRLSLLAFGIGYGDDE